MYMVLKSIYIPLFHQNNNIVLVILYPKSTNLVQSKLLGSDSNEFFEGPNFINKVKYVFLKLKYQFYNETYISNLIE